MFTASVWQRLPPYPSETVTIGAISTLHLLRAAAAAAAGLAFPTHSAAFFLFLLAHPVWTIKRALVFPPTAVTPV